MNIRIIVVAASMFALSGCLGTANLVKELTFNTYNYVKNKPSRPSGAAAGVAGIEQMNEKFSKRFASMTEEELKGILKYDSKKNLCLGINNPRGQSEKLKRIISVEVKARGPNYCTEDYTIKEYQGGWKVFNKNKEIGDYKTLPEAQRCRRLHAAPSISSERFLELCGLKE
jgi:hypothetical protein